VDLLGTCTKDLKLSDDLTLNFDFMISKEPLHGVYSAIIGTDLFKRHGSSLTPDRLKMSGHYIAIFPCSSRRDRPLIASITTGTNQFRSLYSKTNQRPTDTLEALDHPQNDPPLNGTTELPLSNCQKILERSVAHQCAALLTPYNHSSRQEEGFQLPGTNVINFGDGGHSPVLETDDAVGSTSKEGDTQDEDPFLPDITNQHTLLKTKAKITNTDNNEEFLAQFNLDHLPRNIRKSMITHLMHGKNAFQDKRKLLGVFPGFRAKIEVTPGPPVSEKPVHSTDRPTRPMKKALAEQVARTRSLLQVNSHKTKCLYTSTTS
jgi:hypothetical protein